MKMKSLTEKENSFINSAGVIKTLSRSFIKDIIENPEAVMSSNLASEMHILAYEGKYKEYTQILWKMNAGTMFDYLFRHPLAYAKMIKQAEIIDTSFDTESYLDHIFETLQSSSNSVGEKEEIYMIYSEFLTIITSV